VSNNSKFDLWQFIEDNVVVTALAVTTLILGGGVTFVNGLDLYQNKVLTDRIKDKCGVELQVDKSYEVMNDLVMMEGSMVYDYKSKRDCKLYSLSQNIDTLPIKITDDAQSSVYNSSDNERMLITYRENRIQMLNPLTMDTFPYYNSLRIVKPFNPQTR
jgi:hypothetical protein